ETFFKTQGDANEDPDMSELKESAIAGKVLVTIPFLGYLIDFARQPIGFILLIIIPAACIMIDEIRKIWMEVKKMKKEKTKEGEIKSKKDPFLVDKNSGDIEDKKNEKEKEKAEPKDKP
ncbi:MAG: hypothetical protein KAR14_10900, partial [Candidatus Aminicenantes bacterium]|nr:hypothetical protein [Candidatus Aminicenantes bacterium]